MDTPKLAIVIPAFKAEFFRQTLQSIAEQTCQDFTVYIGDDASPYDLKEVVDSFSNTLTIVYKRFETNVGSQNLASHWNRCVSMIGEEEWIWFFSDDDTMDSTCVELFYQHINKHPNDMLLHFNLLIINENNDQLYKPLTFAPYFSSTDFFRGRLAGTIHSCAVEYIFKKDLFYQLNGFELYDLGWSSDDATWIKLALKSGIHTIAGAFVRWRQSSVNISPRSDRNTVNRKLESIIKFIEWTELFFQQHNIEDTSTTVEKARFAIKVIAYTKAISYKKKLELVQYIAKRLRAEKLLLTLVSYLFFIDAKEKVKYITAYDQRVQKKLLNTSA